MRNSLTKPLSGGRPQMATAPTRKQSAVRGIRLRQAAQVVDLAGVGRVDDGAGAQEEQGLEEGVVPDVQQAAAQAEDDPVRPAQASGRSGPGRGP